MSLTDQINNNVKLTKNVTIRPLKTIETMGICKVPNHEKCANVIIEPSLVDWLGNEIYTVPGYNFLKAGSKWLGLALRNLSSGTVTLKTETVVAHVTTVNEIPPNLAPKIIVKASTMNVHHQVSTQVQGSKLGENMQTWMHNECTLFPYQRDCINFFEKFDLSAAQVQSDQEKQEIKRFTNRLP